MSGRPFDGRLLAWACVAVLATYCLFIAGAWAATYLASLRVLALVPAYVAAAVWVIVAVRNPAWRPQTVLAPAFVAAAVVFLVSTIASRNPRWSVEYLALAVLLTALYLLLQRLMASSFFRPRLIGLAAMAGVFTGLAYMAVTIPHWIELWTTVGRITAPPLRPQFESLTFGNPSAVMTVSVLLAAPAVAHLGARTVSRVIGSGLIIGLATLVTVVSGSRSGWLAVGIGVGVVAVAWLADPTRRSAIVRLVSTRTVRILSIPALIAAAGVLIVLAPGFLVRAGAGGEALRGGYWSASLRMFESSPLLGIGPGNWPPLRGAFTLASEPDYYIPHAHSIYFQTLAEFGVLGVAAGIVVAVALARLLINAIRDPEPGRQRMGWAALFATAYFAAHNALDSYANAPAILFAFAIPIAWLDATATHNSLPALGTAFKNPIRRRGLAVAGVLALASSAALLGWSEGAALSMQDGVSKLDDLDVAAAVEPLESAVATDPAWPGYQLALGIALADTGDLSASEPHLAASALADDLPQSWLNLAAVRARLGDGTGARDALDRAMRMGRQQSLVAMGAGVVSLELDDRAAATESFSTALLLEPSLAGDSWWTSDTTRAGIWPDIYDRAFERADPSARFALALESGDTAPAIQAADEETTGRSATYRLVLAAWSGDKSAMAALEAQARDAPLQGYRVNWLRRIHAHLGNDAQARVYGEWSLTLLAAANVEAGEVRVAERPTEDNVAGSLTVFSGHYSYRRPLPHVQLVSWLPQLVFE